MVSEDLGYLFGDPYDKDYGGPSSNRIKVSFQSTHKNDHLLHVGVASSHEWRTEKTLGLSSTGLCHAAPVRLLKLPVAEVRASCS